MELLEYREIEGGALIGRAKVKLDNGIVFNEVKVFRGASGSHFLSLGDKPIFTKDGEPILDQRGRQKYVKLAVFSNAATAASFTRQLLSLIEARPGALNNRGAA
jgi:hypothetical protein